MCAYFFLKKKPKSVWLFPGLYNKYLFFRGSVQWAIHILVSHYKNVQTRLNIDRMFTYNFSGGIIIVVAIEYFYKSTCK